MTQRSSILITGASTGIGAACAIGLAKRGYRVFACVRKPDDGARLERAAGSGLEWVTMDVTDLAAIHSAAETVRAALNGDPLNTLFNNAGVLVVAPLELLDLDDLRYQLEVNVVGPLAVTQAFLPDIRAAKGRIITTGSIGGFGTTPLLGPYCMSKYAVEAFNDALRMELAPQGIKVILLEPASIATGIWDKSTKSTTALLDRAPKRRVERYEDFFTGMDEYAESAKQRASDPRVVLASLIDAIESPRPKSRYIMGEGAWLRRVLRHLPDYWYDSLVLKSLGVRKL